MSRAFVKEPDGDALDAALPDRPQSDHPNYITPAGLASLQKSLSGLESERQALGREGATPEDKLHIPQLERDMRFLKSRIERALPVDPAGQPRDRIAFGATVELEDEEGRRHRYSIVGEDEAEAREGRVSWVSPLARALEGARVGDLVTWRRPAGDLELEVLAIIYEGA
jgi:transcription elongation factor GreB